MSRAVLDSSILIKSIFKPLRFLPKEAYAREIETHDKCRRLLKMIDEKEVEAYVPRACIVETAAVVRRLSNRARARMVSKGIMNPTRSPMNWRFSIQPGLLQRIRDAQASILIS